MAESSNINNIQYENNDIQTGLLTKLDQSRKQYSDYNSKPIHVLADVYNSVDGQLEFCLREESKEHTNERIILIPYHLENSQSTGILIEFQSNGQIERAEYIDPVNELDDVPDSLQKQFINVYPDDILQVKNLPKGKHSTNSTALTIDNLLIAANVKLPTTAYIPKEGNEYELIQLKQKLDSGLRKYNFQNLDELDNEIQDTNERIQKFQRRGRKEDAQKEMNILIELQELKELSDKIEKYSSDTVNFSVNHTSKLHELKENLNNGLIKFKLDDVNELREEIQDTDEQIHKLQRRGRKDDAQKETEILHELQELERISEEIRTLESVSFADPIHEQVIQPSQLALSPMSESITLNKQQKTSLHLDDLRNCIATMPFCAEKIIMELLVYYEERLSPDCTSSRQEDLEISSLQTLRDQIKKEELLTEDIKTVFQDLDIYQTSDNYQPIVHCLNKLLKKIRPLNVPEIKRLLTEAEKTAELIQDQDIILLIGDTGAGKSTTIQFLAGCKMIKTKVKVDSDRFLDHITMDGTFKNPQLNKIKSSPFNKSETRFIAPVQVHLKDVLDRDETEIITLCDAPGFGDTAGPEVDIANSLGVIDALKRAKSVKLLVLTSYKGLGDRGQGIQKLAHILINMVNRIEDNLSGIFYVFTKYPQGTSINAELRDIKRSKVDTDSTLRSDKSFVAVLSDMIKKTEEYAFNIDPVNDEPKELIRKLRRMTGIQYPDEVFRFSMSEETRVSIDKHIERDRFCINHALKHKDCKLLLYYLTDLKILKNLIKKYNAPEVYEQSIRCISESVTEYCTEKKEKFNRSFASQDGLIEDDVREYEVCVKYLKHIQILKDHLGSSVLSPDTLLQNIIYHLEERKSTLREEEDLDSPLIKIYLDNFLMLKNSFKELEIDYMNSRKEFEKRFNDLVQSAHEPIQTNDFKLVAEILTKIFKSLSIIKNHFNEQATKKYNDTVKLLLRHLNTYSNKADPILLKIRLTQDNIDILSNSIEILKSAKENYPLRELISTYVITNIEMIEKYSKDHTSDEYTKGLNEIYDEFIAKIMKYFNEIVLRIEKLFENNEDHALEDAQKLIEDMNLIRTIPELESITAKTYYHSVENVRNYLDQLQRDVEQLLIIIDQKSEDINYKQLVRTLSRLNNTQWINTISPGTYDKLRKRLTEELVEHSTQLEGRLKKLDLSLKCPDNVCIVEGIFEKVLSLSKLEHHFPQIETIRKNILEYFLRCLELVFENVDKELNFLNNKDYQQDQKLKQIHERKGSFDPLSTDSLEDMYSYTTESSSTNVQTKELEKMKSERRKLDTQLIILTSHAQKYDEILSTTTGGNKSGFFGIIGGKTNEKRKALDYLKTVGYTNIEGINTDILRIQNELEKIMEHENTLRKSSISLPSDIEKKDSADKVGLSSNKNSSWSLVENKIKPFIQLYKFNDRLRLSTLNNALLYIKNCEKLHYDDVRNILISIETILRNYLHEYNHFLDQKLEENFNHAIQINDCSEENRSQYSQDLEMSLDELSTLTYFQYIFEYIHGKQKIEHWQKIFVNYYRTVSNKIEDYKICDKKKELREQLLIVQTLSCVDRFCGIELESNRYGALYRQYHVELVKGCKESYKIVLDFIEKSDYANVSLQLSHIDNKLLNDRDFDQIKHDLQYSLNKLMNDTEHITNKLDGKIEGDGNNKSNQIKEIKENLDIIRIVLKKRSIIEWIDDETKIRLQNFEYNLNKTLSAIFLTYLDSIEAFLDSESFIQAEQGVANFDHIQRDLKGYCKSEEITKKTKTLIQRLNNIATDILNQNNFEDVHIYSINPPKYILAKLKIAISQYGGGKYDKAYNNMFDKINKSFTSAIKKTYETSFDERPARIHSLNSALQFLPEELHDSFKLLINKLQSDTANEENTYREELRICLSNVDKNELALVKIGELAEKFCKKNINELFNQLREDCLSNLHTYRTDIQTCLDKKDIRTAIILIDKIFKYKQYLIDYIPEVEGIIKNIYDLTISALLSTCEILANIYLSEQTDKVEKAFSDVLLYLEFPLFDAKVGISLPENILESAREDLEKIFQYLYDNSKRFQVALNDINMTDLYKFMLISKKWDNLLIKINKCRSKHNLLEKFLKDMKIIISYTDMISELEKLGNCLIIQLNVEFINDDTTKFEVKRDELFSNIKRAISTLKIINSKFMDMLPSTFDIEKLEENLKIKIEKIITQLVNRASREELSIKDSDEFRMYYNHLVSFDKNLNISGINIQQVLDSVEEKILEKVISLRKQIILPDISIEDISKILIKMKFLADNLPMFDIKINLEIDEALKIYKEKKGMLGIVKVIEELKKSDPDTRLMSEHSCLTGEDWRRRRDKMQKQDDIEYVLGELTGDAISKEVLRSRYKAFREKYDQLVSSNLKNLDPSSKKGPDVEPLVTQVKYLIGTVTHTSKSITWDRAFLQEIPQILAYIFAIWTLQNTEHYNAMRGIETAQSYLLIPHVGQVISVFRLLGIGYSTHEIVSGFDFRPKGKFSNNLINNLVEIGTGEGKSVVLAITACVFALTGVDVNCSCYSEVLSARDKYDFRLVFNALGIENRIEYGTFNKLCEQFLNEQCNIREKVHEMIATNKNISIPVHTTAHMRPKVLLIDEVDVFLSEQFYGGMYTPSVMIKDPSVKALLDSIWKEKTFKTLNSVRALSTYKTCATQYSNWIFLFDEAIKDMLVALQSYQSSTYIVQDDKIAYVEGESVVDNVLRGYDTVWTYYHENERGKISNSSLETNVGVIINCGTFSYAEMPHDFIYIAGVTGTLRTLAKPEKHILENVYNIHKNTYISSVFGKSNRTYDPTTDVQVVEESKYFMKIREEVNAIREANRAILVFFECEEKLMNFFNSPELSSIKEDVQIIMEKVSVNERQIYVNRASTIGKVTLLTRTFGRGTDFICNNPQLLTNGGIHVLQTFFSKELSEEYQIKGRSARHGNRGSYRMVLLDKDLEWVLGCTWKTDLSKISKSKLYESINKARNISYESICGAKNLSIDQCKRDHQDSKDFLNALSEGNMKSIKNFLADHNRGANIAIELKRTVLLMDATGSMSNLLSAAKETVCTMYERASVVLKEKGLPSDAFQMQFTVYRDYDCKEAGILQSSSWETKPQNLRNFMTGISANGGGDSEEAIEIGLWHAVEESETTESIAQVILVGDAPAKDREAIQRDREASGGELYWSSTKYKKSTHFSVELQKLKEKKIPVHAFYLVNGARENFEKIAHETGGRCESLNIKSADGAELLTHVVTQELLRVAAGDLGDAAVELYRKKYVKKTFTS